jgi:hypothetical protein
MFSRPTPPVHDVDYVEKMQVLLDKHIQCFENLRTELDTYFGKSMSICAGESSPDIQARYTLFGHLGRSISSSFLSMSLYFQPLRDFLDSIVRSRCETCQLLEIYQNKIIRVRKDENEHTVNEEGEALSNFVQSLSHLNVLSNNFVIAFQTTYAPSWRQLSRELGDVASRMLPLAAIPEALPLTDEELALNEAIVGLVHELEQVPAPRAVALQ